MYKKEVTEICVFTKDIFRQDYTKTIEIYEKKFRKFGLTKVKVCWETDKMCFTV